MGGFPQPFLLGLRALCCGARYSLGPSALVRLGLPLWGTHSAALSHLALRARRLRRPIDQNRAKGI